MVGHQPPSSEQRPVGTINPFLERYLGRAKHFLLPSLRAVASQSLTFLLLAALLIPSPSGWCPKTAQSFPLLALAASVVLIPQAKGITRRSKMFKQVCDKSLDWLVVSGILFVTLVVPQLIERVL